MYRFLDVAHPARTLVLTGAAGIGKTTLWEAGITCARERGLRVLLARPSGAEARLSYAASTHARYEPSRSRRSACTAQIAVRA